MIMILEPAELFAELEKYRPDDIARGTTLNFGTMRNIIANKRIPRLETYLALSEFAMKKIKEREEAAKQGE